MPLPVIAPPPASAAQPVLDVFQEMGRSLEIGRTADTVLAGIRPLFPAADRVSLTVLALDGASVVCRRVRGRDADSASPCEPGEPLQIGRAHV